jgi:hypothetical protein
MMGYSQINSIKGNLIMRLFLASLFISISTGLFADDHVWRGLKIEPENRCSSYDKSEQYPYPQSVEDIIVENMGGVVYGPYTGRYFDNDRQTDIEHIVAASEGHDSGLCRASANKRIEFATDLLNLTLAAPEVNRCNTGGKCGFDAAEWMPEKNKCWFAGRVLAVKRKYKLSVDQAEADALESVLSNCANVDMTFYSAISHSSSTENASALDLYDSNRNGRITCSEAIAHGIAPVNRHHPAYEHMNDSDGDGIVCE